MRFYELRLSVTNKWGEAVNPSELARIFIKNYVDTTNLDETALKQKEHNLRQIIDRLENDTLPKNPEILNYYSQFFKVSINYLLGFPSTTGKEDRKKETASHITGLSPKSINLLSNANEEELYIIDNMIQVWLKEQGNTVLEDYYENTLAGTMELKALNKKKGTFGQNFFIERLHDGFIVFSDSLSAKIDSDSENPIKKRISREVVNYVYDLFADRFKEWKINNDYEEILSAYEKEMTNVHISLLSDVSKGKFYSIEDIWKSFSAVTDEYTEKLLANIKNKKRT